ncbi:MAG: hypothetical protein ABMA01_02050 [Chthoniobacteraceae bacterium]
MNAPLARLSAVVFLATLVVLHAEQAQKQDEKAKLITRVYHVPAGLFGLGPFEPGESKLPPGSELKELRPAADGERRFDVWAYLAANGVEKLPGSEAILLQDSDALVVTASAEMQDTIERIVEIPFCGGRPTHLEITATLWEYEDDQFADAGAKPSHLFELRQLAGNSLKLLDSQMIATRNGQRAVTLIKESDKNRTPVAVPASKPANPSANETAQLPKLNGSRGSAFEVEPTIGPDGEAVDMQILYEARLGRPNAEHDIELNVATNLTVMNGQDAIPYRALARGEKASARGGKVKRHALIIGARLVDVDGLTSDERRKLHEQKNEQLIRKAHAGLGAPKK